jgi:glucose dehydrogenase
VAARSVRFAAYGRVNVWNEIMTGTSTHYGASDWLLMIYAVIMVILGLPLLVGGAYLVYLGGSVYYILAGIGLIVAGVLLFRGRMAGFWIYTLTFVVTIIWGLAEVGLNGWALIPWTVGPIILMIISLLFLPVLNRDRHSYRTEAIQ